MQRSRGRIPGQTHVPSPSQSPQSLTPRSLRDTALATSAKSHPVHPWTATETTSWTAPTSDGSSMTGSPAPDPPLRARLLHSTLDRRRRPAVMSAGSATPRPDRPSPRRAGVNSLEIVSIHVRIAPPTPLQPERTCHSRSRRDWIAHAIPGRLVAFPGPRHHTGSSCPSPCPTAR